MILILKKLHLNVKAGSTYHSCCVVVKNMQRCIYAIPSDSVFEDPVIAKHEQDVASALSDPYMLFAAALNGLAGPLHGLANQVFSFLLVPDKMQEVLIWIKSMVDEVGENVSKDQLKDYVWKNLNSGKDSGMKVYGKRNQIHVSKRESSGCGCRRDWFWKDNTIDSVALVYLIISLGLPYNTTSDNRQLAIELAGLVVNWERQRQNEMKIVNDGDGSSQNNDVSSITSNGADPKRSVDGPTLKNDLECHLLQNGLETTGGASANLSLLSSIASILGCNLHCAKTRNTAFGSKLVATAEDDKPVARYGLLVKKMNGDGELACSDIESGRDIPFNYLGLPIGSNMKSIASWKTLVDLFHMRLSSWKANLLSIGGRLTLIKSVLGSLGIYYLSIFRAPESVLQDLERIRANFFWGGNKDKNKMAWVKWPIILNSFDKGGLNIGSLKAFNLALLQKWRWRLLSSPNALWVQVIKAYHGQEGGFDTNGCSFKGIWANIVGTSNFLHSKGIILSNTFRFKAGCGTRIRFWKDIWVGETPLFTRYNRLYHLDQDNRFSYH
ncbi:RNA-directed DNA polymerase, eukaryota, reverse transcriptase zinc-binding domain protein [Tanacetum coccineum]